MQGTLFQGPRRRYSDFADGYRSEGRHQAADRSAPGVQAKHTEFHKVLDDWWKTNVAEIEALPETQNVFELRRHCIDSLAKELAPLDMLDIHQVRGAVAILDKSLESDLKSVAASGWGPELIPEEEILQSQFPECWSRSRRTRPHRRTGRAVRRRQRRARTRKQTESGHRRPACCPSAGQGAEGRTEDVGRRDQGGEEAGQGDAEDADRMERVGGSQKDGTICGRMPATSRPKPLRSGTNRGDRRAVGPAHRLDDELKQLKANIREVEKKKDEWSPPPVPRSAKTTPGS